MLLSSGHTVPSFRSGRVLPIRSILGPFSFSPLPLQITYKSSCFLFFLVYFVRQGRGRSGAGAALLLIRFLSLSLERCAHYFFPSRQSGLRFVSTPSSCAGTKIRPLCFHCHIRESEGTAGHLPSSSKGPQGGWPRGLVLHAVLPVPRVYSHDTDIIQHPRAGS